MLAFADLRGWRLDSAFVVVTDQTTLGGTKPDLSLLERLGAFEGQNIVHAHARMHEVARRPIHQLAGAVAQCAAGRDEAEGAVGARFPGEVGGAADQVAEELSRGHQGIGEIALEGGVAAQHQDVESRISHVPKPIEFR